MNASKIIGWVLFLNYALFWTGGVVSYLYLGGPPADSRWAAPLFLYLAGALTIGMTARGYRLHLVAAGILGLLVEMVGVRLDFPFGSYTYTAALKPFVLGVPLAIGFAWLILFAYVKQMLQRMKIRSAWLPLCGALWMVALDLLIDPLASGPLNYWIWEEQGWYCGVPLVNFLGWFGVSLVLFYIFQTPWPRSDGIGHIGLSIVLFFSLIALAGGVYPSLAAGLALCLVHGLVLWLTRSQGKRF